MLDMNAACIAWTSAQNTLCVCTIVNY